MKRKLWIMGIIVLTVSLALGFPAEADPPPLEDQIEESIAKGLTWLAAQQNDNGSWGQSCDRVPRTGLAVLKFATRAIEFRLDPLSDEYEYSAQVVNGLDYLLTQSHVQAIGVQPAGDPDGDEDGIGVYFQSCGQAEISTTGIVMAAFSAAGGTSDSPALKDILQDVIDYMAWAQTDQDCSLHRGGWRDRPNVCHSDNQNTGYATLGLGYAEYAPPWGLRLTVPQFVKDELSLWADVIQDDVDGDSNDGGSWESPAWPWAPGVNILNTGTLIYEMGLVGDSANTTRVQDAIDYIERHWYDTDRCGISWRDHRHAMFAMMKGFESLGIDRIDLNGDGEPEHDWFEEVARHLIATQTSYGSWPRDCHGNNLLSTEWALLTLEKAVPEFEIQVPVDIKPKSCPNPLNVKSKGILPVAILGTKDLDVTQIDPASIRLEGIAPLRWALDDVARPFKPFIGKENARDCTRRGPDGRLDLTFKFRTQEVVAALGEVNDRDVLVMQIISNLKKKFGGTPIIGEDVVLILKK